MGFPAQRAAGFTLLELLLGLAISGVVMAAVAAFLLAMSSRWTASDAGQSVYLAGAQAGARVRQVVRDARLVGAVQPGSLEEGGGGLPAAVMLWRADRNGDGEIQLSEIGLIEHDRAGRRLVLYEVRFPEGWTAEQCEAADLTVTYGSISASGAPEDFKQLQHVEAVPIVPNVGAAIFHAHAPGSGQRPVVEMGLKVQKEGQINVDYISAALRGPAEEP